MITIISSSMSDWSKAIPTLFPLWRFFIVPTNYEVEMIVCISLIHFWSHRIKKRKSKIAFHLFSFFHCHPMCRCFCLGKLKYRSFLVPISSTVNHHFSLIVSIESLHWVTMKIQGTKDEAKTFRNSFASYSVCFPCKEGVLRAKFNPPLWLVSSSVAIE